MHTNHGPRWSNFQQTVTAEPYRDPRMEDAYLGYIRTYIPIIRSINLTRIPKERLLSGASFPHRLGLPSRDSFEYDYSYIKRWSFHWEIRWVVKGTFWYEEDKVVETRLILQYNWFPRYV